MIVVAFSDAFVAAWVGDGGVFVLHEGGTILNVLEPHKAAATPNLLEASLGPVTDGRPSWAIAPRVPGDRLVVATDGIADDFDTELADLVRAKVEAAGGEAEQAAQLVVEELAQRLDGNDLPLFSDNLTLALLLPTEAT